MSQRPRGRCQLYLPNAAFEWLLAESALNHLDRLFFLTVLAGAPQSVTEAAAAANMHRNRATAACRRLSALGWLELRRDGHRARPVAVIPHQPQIRLAELFETRYALAQYKGEFLMKCYLDLRIRDDEFVDNARPRFLTNPMSDEALEYDRYYLSGVAFEFNGSQHQGLTQKYNRGSSLKERKTRDLLKKGLSQDAQVTLVVIRPDDLPPDNLERLIPAEMPRRPLDKEGPYYQILARVCQAYSAKVRRDGA